MGMSARSLKTFQDQLSQGNLDKTIRFGFKCEKGNFVNIHMDFNLINSKKDKFLVQDLLVITDIEKNKINENYINKGIPVFFEMIRHNTKAALFLLKNGAYNQDFQKYCKNNNINLIQEIVGHYATQSEISDKLKSLDYLYEKGVWVPESVTKNGLLLLQNAKNEKVVQWLLNKGCDPLEINGAGVNSIKHHALFGREGIVKMLKKHVVLQENCKIIKIISDKQGQKILVKNAQASTRSKMVL